jgi:phosphoribosylanthranilate isomerase
MLKNIKVCGVTSPATINQLISLNVSYAGLVFHKTSPRNISKDQALELINGYADKIHFVIVTQDMDISELCDLAAELNVLHLQLHGNESIDYIKSLRRNADYKIIKAIHIRDDNIIQIQQEANKYKAHVDALLLDAQGDKNNFGGTGTHFNWNIIKQLDLSKNWILSGGLNHDNISNAIQLTNATFLDVSSGVESTSGKKDNKKIIKFVNKINEQNS